MNRVKSDPTLLLILDPIVTPMILGIEDDRFLFLLCVEELWIVVIALLPLTVWTALLGIADLGVGEGI